MTALVTLGVVPAKAGPMAPDIMAPDIMTSGIRLPAFAGMAARESE